MDVDDLDRHLRHAIHARPLWREQEDLWRSVPGIDLTTALTVLAEVPARGHLDRTAIAALVEVAPLTCESGTRRGRRVVWGGRAHVRSVPYMAALVTTGHNPTIRAFYQRLCAAGTPKKVALTACRHKLLLILNAITRHHAPWSPPAAA